MASVKKLKSKGNAEFMCLIGDGLSYDYEVRKQQFAALPPAKLLRPLRALRRRYERALALWSRQVDRHLAGDAPEPVWPSTEESTFIAAKQAARRGDGDLVRFWARLARV